MTCPSEPWEKAWPISDWVSRNIRYQTNTENPTAEEALSPGYGECRETSEAFCALCRQAGIPARLIWVLVTQPDSAQTGCLKGYLASEVLIDGKWQPVDPRHPWTFGMLPNDYIWICSFDDLDGRWPNQGLGPSRDTPRFVEQDVR